MDQAVKASLMAYCHLDDLGPEDEALLETLYAAAVEYMNGADVPELAADDPWLPIYHLVVFALVNDAWDNRRSTVTGQLFQNPVWTRMKNQLKLRARAKAAREEDA